MALPNKPVGELKTIRDPEVDKRDVDVLIIGGGMAACGTAFEIKKWCSDDTKRRQSNRDPGFNRR